MVDYSDKDEVIKYFTGKVHETKQIDTAMIAQTLIRKDEIGSGRA